MSAALINAHITFIKVADLDRSHVFYSNGLGLDLVLDQGGCRIYQLTASAFVGVCDRPEPHASNVVITIVSDDVDGWYRRMVEFGVETDGSPRDNADYQIYHFFATDPDGHAIEVQRFWDEAWDQPVAG